MSRREDVGAWMCVLGAAFCVISIAAACAIESCANAPLMRECEAAGGAVVRGQHGGWRCERGRR